MAVAGPLVIGDGVGSDAVTEMAGDQIADTAGVTVNAGGTFSATSGDTIGALTINAGATLTTGGSTSDRVRPDGDQRRGHGRHAGGQPGRAR